MEPMESLLIPFDLQSLLLFLLLGSVVGIIAGLFGVGGGLIIVPALIWGLPMVGVSASHSTHIAVSTSLATIVVTSIAAIRAHHKRRAVLWREVAKLTPGILLGAWLGGMLAGILAKHHGFDCTVLFGVNPQGKVDPTLPVYPKKGAEDSFQEHDIPGLEHLASADLVIFFTRLLTLPPDQLQLIVQYLDSGKPIIGLRTANHGFRRPLPYQVNGKQVRSYAADFIRKA